MRADPDGAILRSVRRAYGVYTLCQWLLGRNYSGAYPSSVKRYVLRKLALRYRCEYFIESGTFHGDTALAMTSVVRHVVSIELDDTLYTKAKHRFRNDSAIQVLHGNSGVLLPLLLEDVHGQTLFWLDGHWDGPRSATARGDKMTPVLEEIEAISKWSQGSPVIVIDDARLFRSHVEYPSLETVKGRINNIPTIDSVRVAYDMIIAQPQQRNRKL